MKGKAKANGNNNIKRLGIFRGMENKTDVTRCVDIQRLNEDVWWSGKEVEVTIPTGSIQGSDGDI